MVKLTPEEKAEKKAQKKKQALEKKRQLKRDVLDRELRLADITLERHEQNWKEMLLKVALPRMKEELEFAWHNFERVIDSKDFQISLLMDELRLSGEQYMLNFKNHIENLEKLIKMFYNRLQEFKRDNATQVAKLQGELREEMENEAKKAASGEEYLKTMLFTLEVKAKEQEEVEKVEYFAKLDEDETKFSQIVTTLKGTLENRYQALYKESVNYINSCNRKVQDRKKEYKQLKDQDDALQILQAEQVEKMFKLVEYIKKLRHKQKVLEGTLGERIKDMIGQHKFFFDAFMLLKKKLEQDRKLDFNQLKLLGQNYNVIKEYLDKTEIKGGHILELASSCRQLETLEEKIMPFPVNITKESIRCKQSDIMLKGYENLLHLFWARVGQADASRYAINEECEFLRLENELLKMKIHRFCLCLVCGENTDRAIVKM